MKHDAANHHEDTVDDGHDVTLIEVTRNTAMLRSQNNQKQREQHANCNGKAEGLLNNHHQEVQRNQLRVKEDNRIHRIAAPSIENWPQ